MRLEQEIMIDQYVNPYRQLYLWATQEVLDLKALQEAFQSVELLEDKRQKLMKTIKMTEEGV